LFEGERVHRLVSQVAVALAQPFPYLAGVLVVLRLRCVANPVDPAFEVGGSAF